MTAAAPPALRIVTFGDLDAGVWGAFWSAPRPYYALGSLHARLTGPAIVDAPDEEGDWRISSDGLELTASPLGELVDNAAFDGFDQLGRVRGTTALEGSKVAVDALCRRGLRRALAFGDADSVRDVSTCFAPDQGLALTAVRPRKARGHDRDVVAGAVLDIGGEHPVGDPRLSTTYAENGAPLRAGLELWPAGDEDVEQYPRRAAGETIGVGADVVQPDFEVRAEVLRWHSRGQDGGGVYLVMKAR